MDSLFSNPFLITIISVTIGWFLNEVSYLYRSRKSDKKIVNLVLSDLLEILWILKANNPRLVMNKLIQQFETRFNTDLSKDEDFQKFIPLIEKVLNEKNEKLNQPNDNFDEAYNKHISELSTIYPILSYRLRGRNKLININKTITHLEKDYLNNLKQAGLEDQNTQKITDYLSTEMKEYNFSQIVEVIESDIKEVSTKSGLATYLKTKNYLKKIDELIDDNIDSGLDLTFEKLESFVGENHTID